MKAILFRDCKACFQSFKNWGMVLIIMVTAIFVEMVASGAGILDPFTWAVFFGPFFIYSSCSVMVSILYQDFRDGLFELYIQSGRSYWSYCWCKCLFPVILTVISVLLNLAFMRVLSSGFQITAGADDAIGALIVSVLGTIVCSLGAMPMVYISRNSDPTMAQLVLVLIAILLQFAYMLVVVNVMPLCLFSVGYVVLVVVAIGISTGVFSRYFINTNIEL